jgi:hypothetical protein
MDDPSSWSSSDERVTSRVCVISAICSGLQKTAIAQQRLDFSTLGRILFSAFDGKRLVQAEALGPVRDSKCYLSSRAPIFSTVHLFPAAALLNSASERSVMYTVQIVDVQTRFTEELEDRTSLNVQVQCIFIYPVPCAAPRNPIRQFSNGITTRRIGDFMTRDRTGGLPRVASTSPDNRNVPSASPRGRHS